MQLSVDSFRALARSSPWRWSTVHLRHRDDGASVEAWIRRPDWMLVRHADGREYVERAGGRTAAVLTVRTDGPATSEVRELAWGGGLTPAYRPDGLVATRPDRLVDYDDPMHGSYRWVAMLDPVELSEGVQLADLRAGERRGRPTWWARARPIEGYDPRCGCCPLLWSKITDDVEYGDRPRYSTDYPDAYDVALDVQTGIVVELRAIGGRAGLDFEVELLEVDADLEGLVAETSVVTPPG